MKILSNEEFDVLTASAGRARQILARLSDSPMPPDRLLSVLGVGADTDLLKAVLQVLDSNIELATDDVTRQDVDSDKRQYLGGALAGLRYFKTTLSQLVAHGQLQNQGGKG